MGRSEDLKTPNGKIRRLKNTQMGRSEDLNTPNGKIRRLKNNQWEDQKT
jgi:hypothetical protein